MLTPVLLLRYSLLKLCIFGAAAVTMSYSCMLLCFWQSELISIVGAEGLSIMCLVASYIRTIGMELVWPRQKLCDKR